MNPYALLGDEPGVTLVFAELPPGERGRWYPDLDVIVIDERLSQAERRCTLVHELTHRRLGHRPTGSARLDARQERECEEQAARLLVPLARLAAARLWGWSLPELADELWVDVDVLQTRLATLTAAERAHLDRRLDAQDWGAA